MNDTQPFLEDTEIYGGGALDRKDDEDEEKAVVDPASLTGEQQRAAKAAEALRQATKHIIRSQQNYQRYSGGFHFLNMKRISEFRDVRMKGLKGEYGGCISIELDQSVREQRKVYNVDYYHISKLDLEAGSLSGLG